VNVAGRDERRHQHYYKKVFTRKSLTCIAAAILLFTGCDRGDHPGQIGTTAPSFSITDSDRTVRLADYKGKVVILNFWASWCAPCLEEFPSLIQLQRNMPRVVVLAVSFHDDEDSYKTYIHDNHIDLLTVFDKTEKSNLAYGTTRPPETYIIDKNGVIRRKFIGPADWNSPEIITYLNKLQNS
jgi:cytochrome c biogenesis protein CcmG, thiol:disulfide interchange protein DsbE